MKESRIVTVRDPLLSLWQSAVAETVAKSPAPKGALRLGASALAGNQMMKAATAHVTSMAVGDGLQPLTRAAHRSLSEDDLYVELSRVHFEMAYAQVRGDTWQEKRLKAELKPLADQCRLYATCDLEHWAQCVEVWLKYYDVSASLKERKKPMYRDWKRKKKNIKTFGVIEYELPSDAKVALIGDWGTGLDDAKELLRQIVDKHKPDAVIHLGDVYYSGTPMECRTNYRDIIDQVFEGKARIPIFAIPGNHEYYARGEGFYKQILNTNPASEATWLQEASYFCLRTKDKSWQFLAMDTGFNDHQPLNDETPTYSGPRLVNSEIEWHRDKLKHFNGRTILLSHHQLFSPSSAIGTRFSKRPWLNEHLYEVFRPYFCNVGAWFWGHEHNLALYRNGLFGLASGRLVGCSAYEAGRTMFNKDLDAYAPVSKQYAQAVPYHSPMIKLKKRDGYYYHGYAVLNFKRAKKSDPVTVSYYQLPSWDGTRPVEQYPLDKIASEKIGAYAASVNLKDYVPTWLKTGYKGLWYGWWKLAWWNMNNKGGQPKVLKLSPRELHLAGPYNFDHGFGKHRQKGKGSFDIHIWISAGKCHIQLKTKGSYFGNRTYARKCATVSKEGKGRVSFTTPEMRINMKRSIPFYGYRRTDFEFVRGQGKKATTDYLRFY